MYTTSDLKNLIHTSDTSAEIEMPFRGTAVNGMLLWLDETLIKQWWKVSDVKLDPQSGGMFYLTWTNSKLNESHTIYGVIDDINTEDNSFKVTKIIYFTDENKWTNMEMTVSFSKEIGKHSAVKLRVSHNFDRNMKAAFDRIIAVSWPKTFSLFREFIEN